MENQKEAILQKYGDILASIEADRVFEVWKNELGWVVGECCDDYFTHAITHDEALGLSRLFAEIAADIAADIGGVEVCHP